MRPEDLNLPRLRAGAAYPTHAGVVGASLPEALTWAQREALRILDEPREVRRRDFMARCGISREAARRELGGLVGLGLLRRIGRGRGARYVWERCCSGRAGKERGRSIFIH